MIQLIHNENVKIFKRSRTWIFVSLVVLALVAMYFVMFTSELRNATHDMNAWHFASIASNLITVVTIFVAVIAGDIVASEFSSGTIKLLLVRPASRTKILWAKYSAVLIFGLLFVLFLLVVSFFLGGLGFGFGGMNMPSAYTNGLGQEASVPMGIHLLRSYAFATVPLIMTVTVSFMISSLFRSSSLAIAISILLLFVGSSIALLLQGYNWDKYILFANENLSQYVTGEPLTRGMSMGFSIVVLSIYFILFHVVAWVAFAKRDVSA